MRIRMWRRGDVADPWEDRPGDELPAQIQAAVTSDQTAIDAGVAARRAMVAAAYRTTMSAGGSRAPVEALHLPPRRRWAFGLVTAVLALAVGVAGVAASEAGGPLYPVRLLTEEAFLPAAPADRLAAQLGRLDRRIDEAEAASRAGNRAGLEAALGAYRSIAEIVEAADPDALDLTPGDRLQLRNRVLAQVRRLETLEALDPAAVSPTLEAGRHLGDRMGGGGNGGQDGGGNGPGRGMAPDPTRQPSG
jgi:hypothetical protein